MIIPYELIGTLIAVVLMAVAFYMAETKGRIVILGLAAATFILPALFPGRAMRLICFIFRMLIGTGCYIFIKWRNAS